MALLLRIVSGSWADRSGRYWTLTFAGYALTAICVPALAVTPFLAGAGLAVACVLILGEGVGKAVRSPAKTALLAVLVIPGAVALLVLLRVRRSMGDPIESRDETATTEATDAADRPRSRPSRLHGRLPSVFWLFAASSAATTAGLVTFAVISYHLTQDHVVPVAAVPLIYAAAMAAEALAALVSGWLFDRTRGRVLAALPLLVTAVPVLAFAGSPLIAITGVLLWGAAGGVLDSTVKALVGSHTADRDLASASKDPNGGSRERSITRSLFSPQCDRHRRVDLARRSAWRTRHARLCPVGVRGTTAGQGAEVLPERSVATGRVAWSAAHPSTVGGRGRDPPDSARRAHAGRPPGLTLAATTRTCSPAGPP
jgi:hypothetical protein